MRVRNNLMEVRKNFSIDATNGTEQSLPDLFKHSKNSVKTRYRNPKISSILENKADIIGYSSLRAQMR